MQKGLRDLRLPGAIQMVSALPGAIQMVSALQGAGFLPANQEGAFRDNTDYQRPISCSEYSLFRSLSLGKGLEFSEQEAVVKRVRFVCATNRPSVSFRFLFL